MEGQAIVCLVGDNIRSHARRGARVFNALDVNMRMISQGASLLNLSFVVSEADLRARRGGAAQRVLRRARPDGVRTQWSRACLRHAGWPSSATARWAG